MDKRNKYNNENEYYIDDDESLFDEICGTVSKAVESAEPIAPYTPPRPEHTQTNIWRNPEEDGRYALNKSGTSGTSGKKLNDDEEEYYTSNGIKTLHVVLIVIATTLFTIILTVLFCRITQDMELSRLRNLTTSYEKTIERLEAEALTYTEQIENLQSQIASPVEDEDDAATKIAKLEKEIERLEESINEKNETITNLRIDLAEAQYRADMYQKNSMWEY